MGLVFLLTIVLIAAILIRRSMRKVDESLASTHAMCTASERFTELDAGDDSMPIVAANYAFFYVIWLQHHPYCIEDSSNQIRWIIYNFGVPEPYLSEIEAYLFDLGKLKQ